MAGIADFQSCLETLRLQAPRTLELLERLRGAPGVLAAKGCGAMGADTMLAVIDREFRSEFFSGVREMNLEIVASTLDLAPAPQLKVV